MNTSIVKGSIGAIAQINGKSIAESFVNANCIVIVDTSGSMNTHDDLPQTRYERACNELAALQNSMPGKIAVLAFSDQVMFCPDGIPYQYGGGTDLAKALKFAKLADLPGMRMILISDGEPNDPSAALEVAKTFKTKIDVIYIGNESLPTGRNFLQKLANATGGQTVTADRAQHLLETATRLLLS